MGKVANSSAVRRLAKKSFISNRTRNWIAVIAIALTTVLFTALFTVGLGMVESFQYTQMKTSGGDGHGVFKGLTQEEYEILRKHPAIKEEGDCRYVSYAVENPEFLKRHVEMHYVPEHFYNHWFIEIIDGKAPEKADEVLMDEMSMELLGLEPKAGQQITLDILVHAEDTRTVQRTFHVTGVTEAVEGMNVGFVFVSRAYLETYAAELEPSGTDDVGKIQMYVMLSSSVGIQDKLNRIITDSGFSTDQGSPDYIASNANWAYISDGAGSDPMTLAAMAGALALILLTGYLIIYNIFQISVIRDIRYYGLLKTIGTTGRQIRRILRWQALWLCLLGVPLGLILGFFIGKAMVPLAMAGAKAEISVSPKWEIFAGALVFTVITVLISQWRPARIAAKVSPIEALRYTGQEQGKRKKIKKSTDGARRKRMALSNLGRSKGRTAVVVCSLSLAVVLLNSVYTITHSIDRESFLSKMILSGGNIAHAGYYNFEYYGISGVVSEEESLSESFISELQDQEGFLDGGRIYMTGMEVGLKKASWPIPDNIATDGEGNPGEYWNGAWNAFNDFESWGEEYANRADCYLTSYHGINPFVLSKMTVVEGEKDKEKIWEKLQTGDYLLYAIDVDDNNFVIESSRKHHAGDKITLAFPDGTQKEQEILAVVKGHSYSLTNRHSSNFAYYVSEEEFKSHLPETMLMSYLFDIREGQEESMEAFLRDYTQNVEPTMSYETRQTYSKSFDQIIGMITIIGTALSAVIALIGFLNFINTILTGIVTRRKEFAMLEAIGMTKRQLSGMLTAEGIFYAGFTILFSLAGSALVSLTVLRMISAGLWFIHYRFTLLPLVIACPALLLLGALVPKVVYVLQGKESIVEQIRAE